MADRVKGITIEIDGDTTGLSQALKGVNGEIRTTQAQLRDVEKLLKLDPKNTTLLEQQQRLLAKAIEETKQKLDTLREAEKQAQQQFKDGKISQEQYEALQREIVATEGDLKKLEARAEEAGKSMDDAADDAKTLGKSLKEAGDEAQEGARKIDRASTAIIGAMTGAAAAIGTAGIKFTAEIQQYQTSFEVMTGSAAKAEEVVERLKKTAAQTPFDLGNLAQSTQLLINYGLSADEAVDSLMMLGDIAQGDAQKLESIATAYGQMRSAQKVTLQDVKQMIGADALCHAA